jgi:DNA-binding PadR family transcriptional regulator
MVQETLGEFEQLALLAVVRLSNLGYGAAIQQELERTANRSVSIATIYVTLVRLEKRGLAASWLSDPTPVPGGKSRRFFRVTPEGAAALNAARAVMNRMWTGLEGRDLSARPGRVGVNTPFA